MKYIILIIASFIMWGLADCIYDPHIVSNTPAWWREIWILIIGVTFANILKW